LSRDVGVYVFIDPDFADNSLLVVIVDPEGWCNVDPQALRDCCARRAVTNDSKLSLFQVLWMWSKSQANNPYCIECPTAWMA
jgi:hypothetical protein